MSLGFICHYFKTSSSPMVLSEQWSRTEFSEDSVWYLCYSARKSSQSWWEMARFKVLSPEEAKSWERSKSSLNGNTGIWDSPKVCLPRQEGTWVLLFGTCTIKKSLLFPHLPSPSSSSWPFARGHCFSCCIAGHCLVSLLAGKHTTTSCDLQPCQFDSQHARDLILWKWWWHSWNT